MPRLQTRTVSADGRGRISLGPEMSNKDFAIERTSTGDIVLTPVVQIPEHEAWLYRNRAAMDMVEQGLRESGAGLASSAGSFAQYAEEEVLD